MSDKNQQSFIATGTVYAFIGALVFSLIMFFINNHFENVPILGSEFLSGWLSCIVYIAIREACE